MKVIKDVVKSYLQLNSILQVITIIILLVLITFGIIYLVKFVPYYSVSLDELLSHITFDRITALVTLGMLFRQQAKLGKIQELNDIYSRKVKDLISEKHSERSIHDRRFKDLESHMQTYEKEMAFLKGEVDIIKNHIVK
jgi:hypothetical protein